MSFENLPSEILLQIASSLSFKDAVNCSLVSKRLHCVLVHRVRETFTEVWAVNQPSPSGKNYTKVVLHHDGVVAQHEAGVDLFEFHPCNKNLCLTAQNSLTLNSPFALIPKSFAMVYCYENRLTIFNLKTSSLLYSRKVEQPFQSILCAEKFIAVTIHTWKTVIYTWNGSTAEPVRELLDSPPLSMSTTGILSYKKKKANSGQAAICDWSTAHFLDCNTLATGEDEQEPGRRRKAEGEEKENEEPRPKKAKTEEGEEGNDQSRAKRATASAISPLEFDGIARVTRLAMSCCARFVAVQVVLTPYHEEIAVYDVPEGRRLHTCRVYGELKLSQNPFSNDSRYLLLQSTSSKYNSITILDLNEKKKCIVAVPGSAPVYGFRRIGDQLYMIAVSTDTFRLVKLDQSTGIWGLV